MTTTQSTLEDSLLIHPRLRLFHTRDIYFQSKSDKRKSLIQPYQVFRKDLIQNETDEAIIFSFSEFFELSLLPGSEINVLGNKIKLKKGEFLIRSLNRKPGLFIINSSRVVIHPKTSIHVNLKQKNTLEITCLSGRAKYLLVNLHENESSYGRGTRKLTPKRVDELLQRLTGTLSYLLQPRGRNLDDELQNEIFSTFRSGDIKRALYHAWLYNELVGRLQNDRGLFITGSRLLIQEIKKEPKNPAPLLAMALLYYLTEQYSKSVQFAVRAKQINRRSKPLKLFLTYFKKSAGLKSATRKFKKLISPENPLFSFFHYLKNLEKGRFQPELLKLKPHMITKSANFLPYFGATTPVAVEIIKRKLQNYLFPEIITLWILNKTEQSIKISKHLKTIFPENLYLDRMLARLYRETMQLKKSKRHWQDAKTILNDEDDLYFRYLLSHLEGRYLQAKNYLDRLESDFSKPLYSIKSMIFALYFEQWSRLTKLQEKDSATDKFSLTHYLLLQAALKQRDTALLEKLIPKFTRRNRSELFQLLEGVNAYLQGDKLKSIQTLENLRNSCQSEKIKILIQHLVDCFLEDNKAEVEKVFVKIDLLAHGLFSD